MKHFFFIGLLSLLFATSTQAQLPRRRPVSYARHTEVDLMNTIVRCLQSRDTAKYYNLFPRFDTLWRMVMHNPSKDPQVQRELAMLKEHPQSLIEFDPMYNRDIIGRFCHVLAKGDDSGIVWQSVVLQRYELQKDIITRNLQGYEHISPERFKGFVFLRDLLSRRTFCITVAELQKINGYFYGGQVLNILEASNIDDFLHKEEKEQQYFAWLAAHPDTATVATDSLAAGSDTTATKKKNNLSIASDEEDETKRRKEVIDRKYYEGKFDNEIPVKLYVRYMKDVGGKVLSFDGLYKFGDQKRYIKLEVVKNAEGKWVMEDEVPLGIMELSLSGSTYTGTWSNNDENGYDVLLTMKNIPQPKIEALDKILDQGASGRIDETVYQQSETSADTTDGSGKLSRKDKKEDRKESRDKERDQDKKDKARKKQDDTDKEWDREQQKAKDKERKKMKKANRPREQD